MMVNHIHGHSIAVPQLCTCTKTKNYNKIERAPHYIRHM